MILFLTLCYVGLVFLLVRIRLLPDNTFVRFSPIPFSLLLFLVLFVPMQWGAPTGPAVVLRNSVSIVPNVAGQVVEVPVKANTALKKGDVLFRIDDTQYSAKVDQLAAQLELAEIRLGQARQLETQNAGTRARVEEADANVRALRAQMSEAQWQLDATIVRAPADGLVTAVGLRPGARVGNFPASATMAFLETDETVIVAQVQQVYLRHVETGQHAEIAFKYLPGQVFNATVESILPAIAEGQVATSGNAAQARLVSPRPFIVRLKLADSGIASALPAGAVGEVAIYTASMEISHVIRKIMIRMTAWMMHVLPT